MADMALGLTKKAVEGTVSTVLAAIDQDTKLKAAAQQDLRFIVDEFQMMRSFLEMVNDNKERTSNKVVKMWVRQLRDLAFDVEDCVEFVKHLDTTSARIWWTWVWRVVPWPSCMTPAWVRDLLQAFDQLKQLKARVDEVSQRNTRYNLLASDDSGSSSSTLPPVPTEQLDAAAFPSTVDILRDLWKANAKQSSSLECNLKYLVADGPSNERRVISVWRSAGVDLEAEHILNAAYLDPEICKEFKARARVKLVHPFNIQEFLKNLLNQLYVTSHQQDTLGADLLRTNGHSVIQYKLRQLLSKNKYLIILEDLSSTVEWDLIRSYLPDLQNGSRIVISTKQLGFALSCTGEPYRVLQLALFPNDRYIYAFYKSGIDITELVKQLGQRRVISLWGNKGGDTSSLVRDVYEAMLNKTAAFMEVNFEEFMWVNVPSPFSLEGFCQLMPWYVRHGCEDPQSYFAGFWRKKVCESRYLLVIEGLQSKEDWNLIKDKLVPDDSKSCIVIIANKKAVAKHCEDDSSRKIDDEELEEANNAASIGPLFAQKEKYYSWGHERFGSHGCSRRIDEALFQFEPFITQDQDIELVTEIMYRHVHDCGVKAVWGVTGVGKSALVGLTYYIVMAGSLELIKAAELPEREVLSYDDLLFDDKTFRCERFGWVDVPEPFDLAEFSRRLLLDFSSYDPVEMEKTAVAIIHGHNPTQRCYEIMRRQRCLVVIDGLRSTRDWDSIQQAFWCHHHPYSSILVITTDESIAKHCVAKEDLSDERIIPIRALDDKSARELFMKIVAEDQNTLNSDLASWEKKAKEWTTEQKLMHANHIVPKCGGLPKIIDAVAKSNRSFWENINDDLVTKLKNDPQFYHLSGVLSWMQSYFDGCSDSVKPCVFYLSVFPTNYKIRKAHLLRRWIAEGYCREKSGCTVKENAESLCAQLIDRDIIQYIGSMPVWRVNGFFREYIISQPMEDNFVFALERHRKPNSQRTVQHLTIMKDWEREEHVFESIDVSRLRSLTVYGKWKPFFISEKMKRIRVLDLEGTCGLKDDDLKGIFGILLSLKLICLRGCKNITCLPKTLGGLKQLESLDVRGTSIVTLPQSITKLKKIQYIRAGMFLPFEDWTSAAVEDDRDCAVGSQLSGITPTSAASDEDCRPEASEDDSDDVDGSQSLGTAPTPAEGTSDGRMVLPDEDCTSAASEDDSDDVDGSQQPSGRIPTPAALDEDCTPEASEDDGDDVDGSQSAASEDDSDDADGSQQSSGRTPTPPEAEGSNGGLVATRSLLPLISQDNKQVDVARLKKLVGCCWTSTKSLQDSDDVAGSQQPSGTTATPEAEGSDGGHHGQHQHHKQQYHKMKKVGRCWTSRLSSQFAPLLRCSRFPHNNVNGGVEVPKGIEDMSALHTLGTVNINTAHGKDFLTKLKGKTKLPQLLKLSVCGINKENWKDLCDALSTLGHLESLSLGFNEDVSEDCCFNNPPKALKSLRLYGHIYTLPAWTWIKDLKKFDLEMIISSQEGMDELVQSLPHTTILRRLCIKPSQQVRKLEMKTMDGEIIKETKPQVLKIDCSSELEVAFQSYSIARYVEVLIIHCSKGSNFWISSKESGLDHIHDLRTVWLKCYDEKAEYVANLKKQIDAHPGKPVFKFEKLKSA